MFNDVHFTGTINLGNIVVALVNLIGALAIYVRVRAYLAEQAGKEKHQVLPPEEKEPGLPPPADNAIIQDNDSK